MTVSESSSLDDFFEADEDKVAWHLLSEKSLERVWANDKDAAYDAWTGQSSISSAFKRVLMTIDPGLVVHRISQLTERDLTQLENG